MKCHVECTLLLCTSKYGCKGGIIKKIISTKKSRSEWWQDICGQTVFRNGSSDTKTHSPVIHREKISVGRLVGARIVFYGRLWIRLVLNSVYCKGWTMPGKRSCREMDAAAVLLGSGYLCRPQHVTERQSASRGEHSAQHGRTRDNSARGGGDLAIQCSSLPLYHYPYLVAANVCTKWDEQSGLDGSSVATLCFV